MLRLASTLLILLLLPFNAIATEINTQGAEKLKTAFENMLSYQKEVNEAFGSVLVIYEGELSVTQGSDYYTITLPHILLKNADITPEQDTDSTDATPTTTNSVFDIGIISINAMPDDKAGYWKMVWTLPETMTLTEEDSDDFTIFLGKQNIISLLDDTLGYATKINLNLSDVHFQMGEVDTGISVGNFQFYMNLDKNETGSFSGPTYLLLKNLLISPPEENEIVKIEELKFSSTMTGLMLPILLDYKAKLLKHAGVFKSIGEIENDSDAENINARGVLDMLFDVYDINMNSLDIEYSLKNVEVTSDLEDETRKFDSLKIGSAFLGFGFDDFNTEKGSMTIRMGYDALDIKSNDPEKIPAAMPTHINFNIKAEDIPYSTLSKMAQNSAISFADNPDSAQMIGLSLMMKLPAILSQAGTKVVVKQNNVKNDIYAVSLNGRVMTDLTAVMGFSAEFQMIFKGLDELLSKIPHGSENEENVRIIKRLEKLKSLGKINTDGNGKTVYTFDFLASPQGSFTLNGQDTSEINFD